ncbi:hypothetical protein SADO_16518 [Salinisphaera dokdonensis CL-ES53]|uniref:Uncharacterized protein n=1 Tax=Salinisphaera dokdonensis CL-ES53 TaxID=1304272 RepID=A0ABV2B4Q1_9GAMM
MTFSAAFAVGARPRVIRQRQAENKLNTNAYQKEGDPADASNHPAADCRQHDLRRRSRALLVGLKLAR